jgi:predicted DNA-binding transcriptional regulator YafY
MRRILSEAMQRPDDLVVQLEYEDAKGRKTTRVISPIRFVAPGRFLGLCLCRCEPRQFYLNRCSNMRLRSATDFVMPVPISAA